MKVYIAGAYAARDVLRAEAAFYTAAGHQVVSTWLFGTRPIHKGTVGTSPESADVEVQAHATADLDQVVNADALVIYTAGAMIALDPLMEAALLTSGGRHVESGVAFASGIPVIVVGRLENIFQRGLGDHVWDTAGALRALTSVRLGNSQTATRTQS